MSNTGTTIDFKALANSLQAHNREVLPQWLPGGRVVGREYVCGNLQGESGDSLKVNLDHSVWKDFASGEGGADLISLYAAINGLAQGDAAKKLAHYSNGQTNGSVTPKLRVPDPAFYPPQNEPIPSLSHHRHGKPSTLWCYQDERGRTLFYVARFDTSTGKQFAPISWNGQGWQWKSLPAPRPLYGLFGLHDIPQSRPVLVVEGEKAAEAAKKIVGSRYAVITWPNGSNSLKKANFKPIYGRKILIWPDADKAGIDCAKRLAEMLSPHCPEVKVIELQAASGSDAADALAAGWNWAEFRDWAKERVFIVPKVPKQGTITPQIGAKLPKQGTLLTSEPTHGGWKKGQKKPKPLERRGDQRPESEPRPLVMDGPWDGPVESSADMLDRLGIHWNRKSGTAMGNIENTCRVFERYPPWQELVWFDYFHQKLLTTMHSDSPREFTDTDILHMTVWLQRELHFSGVKDSTVYKAVQRHAEKNLRHEPKDYFESLKWDNAPRISDFLCTHMGVEPSSYACAASKNFWVSMIARIYRPGCQVDNMLILEGAQGTFKSSALSAIGGKWFTEISETLGTKDFYLSMQGKLLIEISELASFSKAESAMIKKVITARTDRLRPPYGRLMKDFPRQCVFVGSTNDEEYLKDPTGGRRFWPIAIGRITLDDIKRDRDQLFAEAVSLFKAGSNWHEMPYHETQMEQAERQDEDPWQPDIMRYLERNLMLEVTTSEIAKDAVSMDLDRVDQRTKNRIAKVMKRLGWKNISTTSGTGNNRHRIRMWRSAPW